MQDQPLMTSSLRKAKLEEEYSKYERVIIRVQFPDKLVLQGLFRPRETGMAFPDHTHLLFFVVTFYTKICLLIKSM